MSELRDAGPLPQLSSPDAPPGSSHGRSICLLLSGSGGAETMQDPPTPIISPPSGQLPLNLLSAARWAPGHEAGPPFQSQNSPLSAAAHMLSKPPYKWRSTKHSCLHGWPARNKKLSSHTAFSTCQLIYTESLQAQVCPTAPYNSLSSQGWDTNRWHCFPC